MPALLGCTSRSSDFDSLPRGQRGSSAAIHRLQASNNNNSRNEFGHSSASPLDGSFSPPNGISFDSSPSLAKHGRSVGTRLRDRTKSTGSGGAALVDRNHSTTTDTVNGVRHSIDGSRPSLVKKSKSTSSNHSSVLGRRNSALAKRAPPVSSGDYPIVSSDLDADSNLTSHAAAYIDLNGDLDSGSRDSPMSPQRGSTSAPHSPKKSSQARMSGQSPRITSPSIGASARKRVISKDMIGLPTNFQHTGHIGASSYRSAVVDSAALQAQLSEVAAALKFDLDLGSSPSTANIASTSTSPSPAPSAVPKGVPESILEDEDVLSQSGLNTKPLMERDPEESSLIAATSSPPSSSAPSPVLISQALPIVRAPSPTPSSVSSLAASSSRPLPGPPQQAPTSPPPASSNRVDRSESPVRTPSSRKLAPSTVGHSYQSNSTFTSLSSATSPKSLLSRQASATSGVSSALNGAKKRKPVPRALELDPTIGSEDGSESIHPASTVDAEDVPLNAGVETDLQRNVSVVGELPGFNQKVGKRTPLARANQLASAFSSHESQSKISGTVQEGREDEEEDLTAQFNKGPNGTLRLKDTGKKMVQGPGGNYISDTANIRWNSAMKEITLALKDDDEQGGLEEGMRRADQLLGKLGEGEA